MCSDPTLLQHLSAEKRGAVGKAACAKCSAFDLREAVAASTAMVVSTAILCFMTEKVR